MVPIEFLVLFLVLNSSGVMDFICNKNIDQKCLRNQYKEGISCEQSQEFKLKTFQNSHQHKKCK